MTIVHPFPVFLLSRAERPPTAWFGHMLFQEGSETEARDVTRPSCSGRGDRRCPRANVQRRGGLAAGPQKQIGGGHCFKALRVARSLLTFVLCCYHSSALRVKTITHLALKHSDGHNTREFWPSLFWRVGFVRSGPPLKLAQQRWKPKQAWLENHWKGSYLYAYHTGGKLIPLGGIWSGSGRFFSGGAALCSTIQPPLAKTVAGRSSSAFTILVLYLHINATRDLTRTHACVCTVISHNIWLLVQRLCSCFLRHTLILYLDLLVIWRNTK